MSTSGPPITQTMAIVCMELRRIAVNGARERDRHRTDHDCTE
jgi:hypothetical protein